MTLKDLQTVIHYQGRLFVMTLPGMGNDEWFFWEKSRPIVRCESSVAAEDMLIKRYKEIVDTNESES